MSRIPARTDVFYAIADPTRRRILDALTEGDQPVKRLLPLCRMSQPAVSQHLRVLREVRLVRERRMGRERIYTLSADGLREIAEWVERYEQFWKSRLDRLGDYLQRRSNAADSGSPRKKRKKGRR